MKNNQLVVLFLVIALSCGLLGGLSDLFGGQSIATTSDLWPDVPRMEGLNKSDLDLPLPARLAIQGFIKASNQGEGALDVIAFTTPKSAQDLANFYTLERMQAAGWTLSDQPGCTDSASQGNAGGLMCFFGKGTGGSRGSLLVIFAGGEENTVETQVFFARMETVNLPVPSN